MNRRTDYGFEWGPATVTRLMEREGGVLLGIDTPYRKVQVWVSPTGRSVRVFGATEVKR